MYQLMISTINVYMVWHLILCLKRLCNQERNTKTVRLIVSLNKKIGQPYISKIRCLVN